MSTAVIINLADGTVRNLSNVPPDFGAALYPLTDHLLITDGIGSAHVAGVSASPGGPGKPAGIDGSVQINTAGAFDGGPDLLWDKALGLLSLIGTGNTGPQLLAARDMDKGDGDQAGFDFILSQLSNLNEQSRIHGQLDIDDLRTRFTIGYYRDDIQNSQISITCGVTGLDITGVFQNVGRFSLNPTVTDGSGAIAYLFDTATALVNAAARLASFQNNAVEKFAILADGSPVIPLGAVATYVLTCDVNGVGTWQAAGGGIALTLTDGFLPKWNNGLSALEDSIISSTAPGRISVGGQTALAALALVPQALTLIFASNTIDADAAVSWILDSDDAVAANRLIVPGTPYDNGALLTLRWTGANAGMIDSTDPAVALSADWIPVDGDIICMAWDFANTVWREQWRYPTTAASLGALTVDVLPKSDGAGGLVDSHITEVDTVTDGFLSYTNDQFRASTYRLDVQNENLVADNQVITPTKSLLLIQSDNATATNRTFTLASLSTERNYQLLYLSFYGVNQAELLNTGNVKMSGTWTAQEGKGLILMWDQAGYYREIARSG